MAFAAGTRFGAYEITGLIGVGGMGEVYRATDTKLGREVAIKVLAESLAGDGERIARFEREAKTLAAFNHPNIAQIYGLEKADDVHALVIELVEGPTLAERIAQGAIPADEAIGIALQIANALEAAHERGIIHRDLKPANVKLRPDGSVKVLDFGIAKALEPKATMGSQLAALTTPAMTEAGLVLGTAAYMSPEQARGKSVDERTDIWAFGCVLYEMLTGKGAFGGEDVTVTLERDTDMRLLPAAITPAARQTLRLCLQKDIKKRVADIRDVKLALEGAFDAGAQSGASTRPVMPPMRRAVSIVATLAVGGAVVAVAALSLWPEPQPRPVTRLSVSVPVSAAPQIPSISRDGTRIGFRAGLPAQIYVHNLDDFNSRAVPGTEGQGFLPPCFSPDGAWIAYSANDKLWKVPLAGGAPLMLADGLNTPDFCDWGEDGRIYFGAAPGIMRVSESGGQLETVAALDSERDDVSYEYPQLLPGGAQLLFSVTGAGGFDDVRVAVVNLETREQKAVLEGAGYARYAATGPGATRGRLIYGQNAALFAVPFDLSRLEAGSARPVVDGVQLRGASTLGAVSPSGTLAYFAGESTADANTLVWVDRMGAEEVLPERAHPYYADLVLSPDGRRAVVSITDFQTFTADLWVYELEGGQLRRLTFEGTNAHAVWTPDGQRLFYLNVPTLAARRGELKSVPADNSGPARTLARWDRGQAFSTGPTSISFDGRVLLGVGTKAGPDTGDVWVLPLDEGSSATRGTDTALRGFIETGFNERQAKFSPDARFVAYTSNESGRDEVYVVPYPGPGGKSQLSRDGGAWPSWNPNGRELFFVSADSKMMAVEVETSPVFRALTLKALFDAPAAGYSRYLYDVAADGTRFLMLKSGAAGEKRPAELRVVVNWFDELKRLAPTE